MRKSRTITYQPDFKNTLHWLIAGETGSGKSTLTHRVLSRAIRLESPEKLRILWVDFKATAAINYDGLPHLALPPAYSSDAAMNALNLAHGLVNERKTSVINGTAKPASWWMLVLVIDEITELVTDCKDAQPKLNTIARLGREFNVVIVCATQYPTASTIDSQYLQQMTTRACFRVANKTASRVVLDMHGAEELPPYTALCRFKGVGQIVRKKFDYLNPKKDIPDLVEWARGKYGDRDYLDSPAASQAVHDLDSELAGLVDLLRPHFQGQIAAESRVNDVLRDLRGSGVGAKKRKIITQALNDLNRTAA